MNDKNNIIDALIIIRDVCNDNICATCPFRTDAEECGITNGEPAYWLINESWRAFK